MIRCLVALLAVALQNPASPADKGATLAVSIAPSAARARGEIRVALFPPDYAAEWYADVQMKVDDIWDQGRRELFSHNKELFPPYARLAHLSATEYVIGLMRRDGLIRVSDFVRNTPDGKFEYRNLMLGDYKIVATGRTGTGEDVIWEGSANLTNSAPQALQLKIYP